MKIELVYWRDAYFIRDDEGGALPHREYIMEAVGWVDVQGKFLTIRAEKDRQTKNFRAVTRVPLECVVERIPLVREPKPDGTVFGMPVMLVGDGGTE